MKVIMLSIALTIATVPAWGDSILPDLFYTGNFSNGNPAHSHGTPTIQNNGLYMMTNRGKMDFNATALPPSDFFGRFVGSTNSSVPWNGSTFSGTFSGIEDILGFPATCGTHHPTTGSRFPCSQIFYVTGTYSGTWDGKRQDMAHVQLHFTSASLLKSGLVPEPGTWAMGLTGLIGLMGLKWRSIFGVSRL